MSGSWAGDLAFRRAWYQDLFVRRKVRLSDGAVHEAIENQREFFMRYLCWLRDLHAGNQANDAFQVSLADATAFPSPGEPEQLADEKFGRLLGEAGRGRFSLEDLLRRMAFRGGGGARGAAGFGYFQRALYEECAYEN